MDTGLDLSKITNIKRRSLKCIGKDKCKSNPITNFILTYDPDFPLSDIDLWAEDLHIRFDNSPRVYTKEDFQHLVDTVIYLLLNGGSDIEPISNEEIDEICV